MKRKEESMTAIVFSVLAVIGGVITAVTEGRSAWMGIKSRRSK